MNNKTKTQFHAIAIVTWCSIIIVWLSVIYQGPLARMDPAPDYHLVFAFSRAYNFSHRDTTPILIESFDCWEVVVFYYMSCILAVPGLSSVYMLGFVVPYSRRWQNHVGAWTFASSCILLMTLFCWFLSIWRWYRSCLAPFATDPTNVLDVYSTYVFDAWMLLVFVTVCCFAIVLFLEQVRKRASSEENVSASESI